MTEPAAEHGMSDAEADSLYDAMGNKLKAARDYEIEPGADADVCPLCGIGREYAGWTKATCGEHFREPGCFVKR